MRRLSRGFAVASLVLTLAASNIYARPSRPNDGAPDTGRRIVKIIKRLTGISLDDLSWPKP